MSRPDPTWYGNVIRSYVAWLTAAAMALVAAWPFWHYSQTHSQTHSQLYSRWDPFGVFLWSIFVFLAVGVVAGVVMNRVVSLPYVSSLATLGIIWLAFLALPVDVRLGIVLFIIAPGISAAIAAIPGASGDTCERICLWIYGFLLIGLVISLVWA